MCKGSGQIEGEQNEDHHINENSEYGWLSSNDKVQKVKDRISVFCFIPSCPSKFLLSNQLFSGHQDHRPWQFWNHISELCNQRRKLIPRFNSEHLRESPFLDCMPSLRYHDSWFLSETFWKKGGEFPPKENRGRHIRQTKTTSISLRHQEIKVRERALEGDRGDPLKQRNDREVQSCRSQGGVLREQDTVEKVLSQTWQCQPWRGRCSVCGYVCVTQGLGRHEG